MMKQVYSIAVLAGLIVCSFDVIFAAKASQQLVVSQKNISQIECRILDDSFDLELLRSEFELIKKSIIHRSKHTNIWQGIPLKNALGTTEKEGLQLYSSVKNNAIDTCYPTPYLNEVPYIGAILDAIEKRFQTEVGLVRIFKLPAQNSIKLHSDGEMFDYYSGTIFRLHIPIVSSSEVQFIIDKKAYYLEPGKLYFTNVFLPHAVINNSKTDRIHLVIDVRATKELRDFIFHSKEPIYTFFGKNPVEKR